MIYINSSFLSLFVNEKLVGLAYALGSIFSILALLMSPKIFRKLGGHKFLLLVIALDALSILLFAFSKNAFTAVLVFIFGLGLNTLIVFSIDELLKIFSKDSAVGSIRGIYISVCHLAAIASQIAFGTFLGYFSFKTIYIIAFSVMLLFFLLVLFKLKNIPDPNYDKIKSLKYVEFFFKNKNLLRAYAISFLLQFFYCWMIIYTPIYLYVHLGFSWKEIGTIFAVMLLPFLAIPFQVGKYADRIGERKILMFGFTVAALATISLFFIRGHSLFVWAMLLLATRIGASMIEVVSDAYFFKHIKPENEEFVGVYRSADPMAYILGPIIASIFFIFIPSFSFIYLILATLLLYGIYLSSTIEKSDI
jgi:MFS family permease